MMNPYTRQGVPTSFIGQRLSNSPMPPRQTSYLGRSAGQQQMGPVKGGGKVSPGGNKKDGETMDAMMMTIASALPSLLGRNRGNVPYAHGASVGSAPQVQIASPFPQRSPFQSRLATYFLGRR